MGTRRIRSPRRATARAEVHHPAVLHHALAGAVCGDERDKLHGLRRLPVGRVFRRRRPERSAPAASRPRPARSCPGVPERPERQCLKPASQLGRVIYHDRDIAIRGALERFRRQARSEVRRQQGWEPVADAVIQPRAVPEPRLRRTEDAHPRQLVRPSLHRLLRFPGMLVLPATPLRRPSLLLYTVKMLFCQFTRGSMTCRFIKPKPCC